MAQPSINPLIKRLQISATPFKQSSMSFECREALKQKFNFKSEPTVLRFGEDVEKLFKRSTRRRAKQLTCELQAGLCLAKHHGLITYQRTLLRGIREGIVVRGVQSIVVYATTEHEPIHTPFNEKLLTKRIEDNIEMGNNTQPIIPTINFPAAIYYCDCKYVEDEDEDDSKEQYRCPYTREDDWCLTCHELPYLKQLMVDELEVTTLLDNIDEIVYEDTRWESIYSDAVLNAGEQYEMGLLLTKLKSRCIEINQTLHDADMVLANRIMKLMEVHQQEKERLRNEYKLLEPALYPDTEVEPNANSIQHEDCEAAWNGMRSELDNLFK